ncbi:MULTISPECIES: hypothetical protein [unclassified Rhizobium]|uniref:hypothetical protein n=1 Tax=unclassified Rhizobium TaxID=2613769 RepID=UPI003819F477
MSDPLGSKFFKILSKLGVRRTLWIRQHLEASRPAVPIEYDELTPFLIDQRRLEEPFGLHDVFGKFSHLPKMIGEKPAYGCSLVL